MKKQKPMTVADSGRKGGEATFKKLGREHYVRIATMRKTIKKK